MAMESSEEAAAVYHERQELYRCGIHALNNVLQGTFTLSALWRALAASLTLSGSLCIYLCCVFVRVAKVFEKATLDGACQHLAALTDSSGGGGSSLMSRVWNPHRSPLGLGNYDVNALMYVLEEKGYKMQWVDKRRPMTKELLDCDALEGVLCNVVLSGFLRSVWEQRHWFAIKKIGTIYYNLDSKLAQPMPFASEEDCFKFLQELVGTGECELFSIAKASDSEEAQ